MEKYL